MLRIAPVLLRTSANAVVRRPIRLPVKAGARTGRVIAVRGYSQDNVTEVKPEPVDADSREQSLVNVCIHP